MEFPRDGKRRHDFALISTRFDHRNCDHFKKCELFGIIFPFPFSANFRKSIFVCFQFEHFVGVDMRFFSHRGSHSFFFLDSYIIYLYMGSFAHIY